MVPAKGGFLNSSPGRYPLPPSLFMVVCHDAARRQGTLRVLRQRSVLIGSPAYDSAPRRGAGKIEPAAAAGWSSLQANTDNPMDTEPSFAERIRALKAAAETAMLEAQRMEAAEQRFAERRNSRSTSRKTERASR